MSDIIRINGGTDLKQWAIEVDSTNGRITATNCSGIVLSNCDEVALIGCITDLHMCIAKIYDSKIDAAERTDLSDLTCGVSGDPKIMVPLKARLGRWLFGS